MCRTLKDGYQICLTRCLCFLKAKFWHFTSLHARQIQEAAFPKKFSMYKHAKCLHEGQPTLVWWTGHQYWLLSAGLPLGTTNPHMYNFVRPGYSLELSCTTCLQSFFKKWYEYSDVCFTELRVRGISGKMRFLLEKRLIFSLLGDR